MIGSRAAALRRQFAVERSYCDPMIDSGQAFAGLHMAQRYGDRWEMIDAPRLGKGGQGEVFRVRDITGHLEGEFALKRVPNIIRRQRFRHEVEAIKLLTDPEKHGMNSGVVPLIDHSALDDIDDGAKQFLVMPIARGGDLSNPDRLALYIDSIDAIAKSPFENGIAVFSRA
jgi:serine/threonine protein kinase